MVTSIYKFHGYERQFWSMIFHKNTRENFILDTPRERPIIPERDTHIKPIEILIKKNPEKNYLNTITYVKI